MTQRRPLPHVTDVARTLARLTKGEHFGKSVAMRIDEPIAPLSFTLGTSRGPSSKYAYRDGPEDRIGHGSFNATSMDVPGSGLLAYGINGLLERPSLVYTTSAAEFAGTLQGDALTPPQTTRTGGEFFRVPPHVEDIDLFEILGHGSFAGTDVLLRGARGTVLDSGTGGATDAGDDTIFTEGAKTFLASVPNDGGGPANPLLATLIHIHGHGRFWIDQVVSNTELKIASGAGVGLSGLTYDIVACHPSSLAGCTTSAASPIITTISNGFAAVVTGNRIFLDGAPDPFTVVHKTGSNSITVDREVGVTHAGESGSWYAIASKVGPHGAGATTIASAVVPLFLPGVPGGVSGLRGYQGMDTALLGGTPSGLDSGLSLAQKYIKVMSDCVFLWIEGHDRLYLLSNVSDGLTLHLGTTPAGGYYENILEVPAGTGGLQKDITGFEAYMVFRAGASTYQRIPATAFTPVLTKALASGGPWSWGYLLDGSGGPAMTAYCPAPDTLPVTPTVLAWWDTHSCVHSRDTEAQHSLGHTGPDLTVADWIVIEGARVITNQGGSNTTPFSLIDDAGILSDAAGNPMTFSNNHADSRVMLVDSLPLEVGPGKMLGVLVGLTGSTLNLGGGAGTGEYIDAGLIALDVFYRRFRL